MFIWIREDNDEGIDRKLIASIHQDELWLTVALNGTGHTVYVGKRDAMDLAKAIADGMSKNNKNNGSRSFVSKILSFLFAALLTLVAVLAFIAGIHTLDWLESKSQFFVWGIAGFVVVCMFFDIWKKIK